MASGSQPPRQSYDPCLCSPPAIHTVSTFFPYQIVLTCVTSRTAPERHMWLIDWIMKDVSFSLMSLGSLLWEEPTAMLWGHLRSPVENHTSHLPKATRVNHLRNRCSSFSQAFRWLQVYPTSWSNHERSWVITTHLSCFQIPNSKKRWDNISLLF